jgi:hypothetical protein
MNEREFIDLFVISFPESTTRAKIHEQYSFFKENIVKHVSSTQWENGSFVESK